MLYYIKTDQMQDNNSTHSLIRVVFVVETTVKGGNFATMRIFNLDMMHFGAFSVAKEVAVTGT